jgi:hypothetical protein
MPWATSALPPHEPDSPSLLVVGWHAMWTSSLGASWCSDGAAVGRSSDPQPPAAMRRSRGDEERLCDVAKSWGGREAAIWYGCVVNIEFLHVLRS